MIQKFLRMLKSLLNMFTQLLGLPYIVAKKAIQVLYKVALQAINTIKITAILLKDTAVKILKGIWNSIKKIIEIIVKFITGVVNTVKKVILGIYSGISKVVTFIWKYLLIAIKYIPKILTGIVNWLWKAVKESIAQIFTLLGFFIAWLTLTGSAKDIVGIAILVSTALWLLTIGLREDG
tara:strand:- start:748 stop:1284 length:537 start_codon:yes stop_codon:yes gene_type:complete